MRPDPRRDGKKGQPIMHVDTNGHPTQHKVVRIEGYHGLEKSRNRRSRRRRYRQHRRHSRHHYRRYALRSAPTSCSSRRLRSLNRRFPSRSWSTNGPFVGKDGKHVTMNKIRDRLLQEKKANISLENRRRLSATTPSRVSGRGELHLAVLIEAMRRENYEFTISKPQVILKEIDGVQKNLMKACTSKCLKNFPAPSSKPSPDAKEKCACSTPTNKTSPLLNFSSLRAA